MKSGLSRMDINKLGRLLKEEEPMSVKELATYFNTSVTVIKAHTPMKKKVFSTMGD